MLSLSHLATPDFQSAFHRGNGCYRIQMGSRYTPTLSVRFSSRQWLLPFLAVFVPLAPALFQSAFHRGNGCYKGRMAAPHNLDGLSVRFSSRQWLLPTIHAQIKDIEVTFSPLFIAAMVATYPPPESHSASTRPFSPLFIAAMVATPCDAFYWQIVCTFSPLFIGAWTATTA